MPMDQWLAQVYGTGTEQLGAEDLEKIAQAQMLEKLAADEGVSLEGLSEEDLETLSEQILQGQGGVAQPQVNPEEQQQMAVKEAQAKFEEADFLGRVMAHSYTNELEKIATEGGKGRFTRAHEAVERGGRHATDRAGKAGAFVGRHAGKAGKAVGHGAAVAGKAVGRAAAHAGRFALKHRGKGAIGAAVVGAGVGAHHAMKKQASAFDTLAEQRALEILAENGIDPSQDGGDQETSQEEIVKQAMNEQFNSALEQRAYEMLQENGYVEDEDPDAGQGGGQPQQ